MNKNLIFSVFYIFLLTACATTQSAQPTPTTVPTTTPIPSWQKFEAEGFEFWLPDSYFGGNIRENLDSVVEKMRSLGGQFEQMAQTIEQNPEMFVIMAADSESGASGYPSNVGVAVDSGYSTITVDKFLEEMLKETPSHIQVLESEVVSLGYYEAGRIVAELTVPGIKANEVMYFMIDGDTLWMVTYTAGEEDFEEQLPIFERSASTIVIKRASPAQEIIQPVVTPETKTSPIDGMTIVFVPAGEFLMGSGEDDRQADDDEKPQRSVYLDAYWIDQTEVTNAMFAQFVEDTRYVTAAEGRGWSHTYNPDALFFKGVETSGADWAHPAGPDSDIVGLENHPVVHVTWSDARAYCEWAGRRLPTEAEWEKAARGVDGRNYPWGNAFDCKYGNFDDETNIDGYVVSGGAGCDGYDRTSPVGSFPTGASPYSALDMAGNVVEWVADWYDETYYEGAPQDNPPGPTSGEYRVMRGGEWFDEDSEARTTYRDYNDPDATSWPSLGFRCALTP